MVSNAHSVPEPEGEAGALVGGDSRARLVEGWGWLRHVADGALGWLWHRGVAVCSLC